VFPKADFGKVDEYRRRIPIAPIDIPMLTIADLRNEPLGRIKVKNMTNKGLQEATIIAGFQYHLFSLSECNFEEGFRAISKTRFVTNRNQFPEFVHSFLMALRIRYQSIDSSVELFRRLQSSSMPHLLVLIFEALSRNLKIGDPYPKEVPSFVFCPSFWRGIF
jgi:hypothetical protein